MNHAVLSGQNQPMLEGLQAMYPHPIRLRGPWEVEPVARLLRHADGRVEALADRVPAKFRVILREGCEGARLTDFVGRTRWRRRFGYPGRIDSHERVWLTFSNMAGAAEVWLNGVFLGRCAETECSCEFEITGILGVRNELVVQVDAPEGDGKLWGNAALEVRCTAFLRRVRAWASFEGALASLHVAGDVVGTADQPLELYVLLDGSTIHYSTVTPEPQGRPFQVTSEPLMAETCRPRVDVPGGGHVVRVDLVNGATIWYVVELVVALEGGEITKVQ